MTTRKKTLIFHIGDHKTGSTSIQLAFAGRRIALQDRRVFYPGGRDHNWLKGHLKAYGTNPKSPAGNEARAVFQKLAGKIRTSDADFCVISAETIQNIDPAVFRDMVTNYFADAADDIRIVAYVRPHAPRVLSSFAERIKLGALMVMDSGPELMLERLLQDKVFPYHARFAAWRREFGAAFLLRPMIRSQLYQGSAVEDFVHHAFATTKFEITGSTTGAGANESLDLVDLMRLKYLHNQCRDHDGTLRHALGWEFARVAAALPPPKTRTRLQLHQSLARDIHAACIKDARAVDRDFFDGAPLLAGELNAALETATRTAQSFEPADWLGADERRGLMVMSNIISGMAKNPATDWPAYWRTVQIESLEEDGASAQG